LPLLLPLVIVAFYRRCKLSKHHDRTILWGRQQLDDWNNNNITREDSRAKPDNTEQQWTSSTKQNAFLASRLAALFVRNAKP
jgi:hypothetical protein